MIDWDECHECGRRDWGQIFYWYFQLQDNWRINVHWLHWRRWKRWNGPRQGYTTGADRQPLNAYSFGIYGPLYISHWFNHDWENTK